MSLTLRDAQHLCWKTFRKLKTKTEHQTSIQTSELVKSAEKIVSEIQNATSSCENLTDKENLQKLFSEILYLTFVLAEHYNINLEESFMQTINEYILGFVI
ncbi:MAG: hypothetical protein N3F10_03135 [Candidatus Bathyarchaeota archaeon]|nr:hypothetical protein [Candidatus Bathyarchaeota archaeon]